MDLITIRTQAAKNSGRFDLSAPPTFPDSGMDMHITAGQEWLNKISNLPRAFAHLSTTLATGAYAKDLSNKFKELRAVTVNNGATSWSLGQRTLAELEALYESGTYTVPTFYANASYRTLSTAGSYTLANFVDLEWPADDDERYDYHGIIVVPAADTNYTVIASGDFMPLELSNDSDTNFWSDEYPHILIMAALRSIAVLAGDDQRAAYLESAISSETGWPVPSKPDAARDFRTI